MVESQDLQRSILSVRRNTLLTTLPFIIVMFFVLPTTMAHLPGVLPGEHRLPYLYGIILCGGLVAVWKDPRYVPHVAALTVGVIFLLCIHRTASLVYGPAFGNPDYPVFLPVYAYMPFAYLAMFILTNPRTAMLASLLLWLSVAGLVASRVFWRWDLLGEIYGVRSLVIYLLLGNPLYIFALRAIEHLTDEMGKIQVQLAESRLSAARAEAKLEAQNRFELAVRGSRDGLWEWPNIGHPEVWCSDQACRLLGLDPATTRPNVPMLYRKVHPDFRQSLREALETALGGGEDVDLELQLLTRTRAGRRKYRWFLVRGVVQNDADGSPKTMAGSLQDIHRRKVAEEQLLRSRDALKHFAHSAAHDIAAPVNRVGMLVDLVARRHPQIHDDAKSQDNIRRVHREIEFIGGLMDRMLQYAQIESTVELESVDAFATAEQARDSLADEIRRVDAEFHISPDLPRVLANREALRATFQNLFSNALKFNRGKPVVRVTAERQDGCVALSVSDNGTGIRPEAFARILAPFGRAQETRDIAGHGLGLAAVNRLVASMRGTLSVESEFGSGSTFTVTLEAAGDSEQAN